MTLIAEGTEGPFSGMDDLDDAPVKDDAAAKPKRKKASKSPTRRSLEHMRAQGYTCEVVEHWNPFVGRRKDLFGFIDVMCLRDGETVAVQTTSASCMSDRVKKIAEHENVAAVRAAGWRIVVHGWRKNAQGRWVMREVDVS